MNRSQEEKQDGLAAMDEAASRAEEELRTLLTRDAELTAKELVSWIRKYDSAAGYKRLCRIAKSLIGEP